MFPSCEGEGAGIYLDGCISSLFTSVYSLRHRLISFTWKRGWGTPVNDQIGHFRVPLDLSQKCVYMPIFLMVISPTFMMILTAKTSLRLVLKWRLK